MTLLLQDNAIWVEERQGHLSKVSEQDISKSDWQECQSLHGRYVGEEHPGNRTYSRSPRDFLDTKETQDEA